MSPLFFVATRAPLHNVSLKAIPMEWIIDPVQRLAQRFVTLIRPQPRPRPQLDLGAFSLPHEIILLISSRLTPVSKISLALTCRTLHSICLPQRANLDVSETVELLLSLEKDVSHLYFCHYCTKLHRWHSSWGWDKYGFVSEKLPCRGDLDESLLCMTIACYVPYHHARLVMNRHFYGPSHGFAPSRLHNHVHHSWSQVNETETLDARIVDNQLVLRTTRTVYDPKGNPKTLRDDIERNLRCICKHLIMNTLFLTSDVGPMQIPELSKGKRSTPYFAPCTESFRSCTYCPTDYSIEISGNGKNQGYVIKLFVYRLLGDCRSPFDWNWRVMTTGPGIEVPRITFVGADEAGAIRDLWNKGNDVIAGCKTTSSWVEVPDLPWWWKRRGLAFERKASFPFCISRSE